MILIFIKTISKIHVAKSSTFCENSASTKMEKIKQEPEDLNWEEHNNQRIGEDISDGIFFPKIEPEFYNRTGTILNSFKMKEEDVDDIEYKPILQCWVSENSLNSDYIDNFEAKESKPTISEITLPKTEPFYYDKEDSINCEDHVWAKEDMPEPENNIADHIKVEISENPEISQEDQSSRLLPFEFQENILKSLEHKHFLSNLTSISEDLNLKNRIDDNAKHKNYKCHLCKFESNQRGRLKLHLEEVHLKLKTLKCDSCSYVTTRKSTLKRHMDSVHATVRCHKCDLCDYSTTIPGYVKKHVAIVHMKVKNYKCNMCSFKSATKTHLEIHISAVHFKIKNFKCDYCEYSAARKSNLKKHVDIVHLNK